MNNPLVKLIAAKSNINDSSKWLPLWMHSRDTAGIMAKLWDNWLPEAECAAISGKNDKAEMRRLCVFMGLVHDIGKATVAFQKKITGCIDDADKRLIENGLDITMDVSQAAPHAVVGSIILEHKKCPACIASVVGAHHGKPRAKEIRVEKDFKRYFDQQPPQWEQLWNEIINDALEYCGYADADEMPKIDVRQQMLLSGLLIMADWIASNEEYFPLINAGDIGEESRYPKRVEDGWNDIELPYAWTVYSHEDTEERFIEQFGCEPYSVQRMMMKHAAETEKPGIFILEGQMGCGKTEAALAAAEIFADHLGSGGIFFGLPTQATANGIFPRLEKWAEKQPDCNRLAIKLAHGMAELNEDYRSLFGGNANLRDEKEKNGRPMVHEWFEGRKVALLSNFVIGTVDQLLMAALKQKHVMLRHLGLAGKVVIVDEVHAYDAYMNQYLDMALTWLGKYNVPVILLSATLPEKRRKELINAYLDLGPGRESPPENGWKAPEDYPLLTWTVDGTVKQDAVCAEKEHRAVRINRIEDDGIIEKLSSGISEGGSACVILNTVKRAQKLAESVKNAIPDAEVLLFHAQFIMPDRAELEKEIMRRLGKDSGPGERNRLIVIGTQVLEQSLDIDADMMITDLCPMDLMMQRIGRLHRHRRHDEMRPARLKTAVCYVVTPGDGSFQEGAKAVYGEWPLMRTARLLPDRIALPDDIPVLVQAAYDEESIPAEERRQKEEFDRERGNARCKAEGFCIATLDYSSTINGLLSEVDPINSDSVARAAVRDGDPAVEVIMLMEKGGEICFLPWQQDGGKVPCDCIPSLEEQYGILRQRIRLPHALCHGKIVNQTIEELEKRTLTRFAEWQYAPLLKEELVLLLDDELQTELNGHHISYSKEYGMECESKK